MDLTDLENLLSIVHKDVVKYKYESQTNLDLSKAERDWMKKHGDYIEKDILNKIVAGIQ